MTKSYNPAALAKIDAELTEAGYDMTRSWVALCVDGVVHGVGTTEAKARRDTMYSEEYQVMSDDTEIEFVAITEYQASRTDNGNVDIAWLVRAH